MNKALLDTDILSEIGRGVNTAVLGNATSYQQMFGRYITSAASIMKVVRGFQRKQSPRRLQTFLASTGALEVLPLDEPAGELAGRIVGELERLGRPIGVSDPMFAAIALTHGLELVTGNTAH